MQTNLVSPKIGCNACSEKNNLDFDFTMAFQPIVNFDEKKVFAQEALVRGLNGEPAGAVISRLSPEKLYKFDQTCRVKAVSLASKLNVESFLSINFMPNAVYQPEHCLRTTIKTATENDFPLDRIIFEITEVERVNDHAHLKNIIEVYKNHGFKTAIDDFGEGYSGLNLLAEFQPDIVKLDMKLIRNIDRDRIRRMIVKSILLLAEDLGVTIIAEGIETRGELDALRDFGVNLFQGFYFARPAFESLAEVSAEIYAEELASVI